MPDQSGSLRYADPERVGNFFFNSPLGFCLIQGYPSAKIIFSIKVPQYQIRIGDRRLNTSQIVADRSRHRPGTAWAHVQTIAQKFIQ